MIAGMGTGETGALGAIIYQYPNLIGQIRIPAGPESENDHFYQRTAEQIADDGGHDQPDGPPASPDAEIV